MFCDYISTDSYHKTIYRTVKCFSCGWEVKELDENGKVSVL